jgi:hypothetical protein
LGEGGRATGVVRFFVAAAAFDTSPEASEGDLEARAALLAAKGEISCPWAPASVVRDPFIKVPAAIAESGLSTFALAAGPFLCATRLFGTGLVIGVELVLSLAALALVVGSLFVTGVGSGSGGRSDRDDLDLLASSRLGNGNSRLGGIQRFWISVCNSGVDAGL